MAGLPHGKQIWIRGDFRFHPEETGFVGWTKEADRDRVLNQLNDGDLMLSYCTVSSPECELRRHVLGFAQIDAVPVRDFERATEDFMTRKRQADWRNKWQYRLPVRRAWRTEEAVLIGDIAFNTYQSNRGMVLTIQGAPLDPEEIEKVFAIRVREVNVFGEPPITEGAAVIQPLAGFFKPSRAFPG
ncbi:MAG: hypothetical protein GDA55_04370 [Cellvibrionales bacterium]|nr:hypothetical protein [Cellvibrionales bacterium]